MSTTNRHWVRQAAINGDVEELRRELAIGHVIDEYDIHGMTLLHFLCAMRPGGDRLACFHLAPGTDQWRRIQRYPEFIYLKKVAAAGGYRNYERDHLSSLANIFSPKFSCLPPEMVRRVVEYAFDVGGH